MNTQSEKLQIENILSSRGRVKIIKVLAKEEELNISEIVKRVRLNHSTVAQHLGYLCKVGIIQEKTFGRIRIYRLKTENAKVRALKTLFSLWES
ncbi:MAG: ArsR/SmtB family transcription factor [Candidatus Baldrarchaeia archaeon]|nr:ArsR family transcriptional regulator [Candidatus Baldrarchaeota archaeon]